MQPRASRCPPSSPLYSSSSSFSRRPFEFTSNGNRPPQARVVAPICAGVRRHVARVHAVQSSVQPPGGNPREQALLRACRHVLTGTSTGEETVPLKQSSSARAALGRSVLLLAARTKGNKEQFEQKRSRSVEEHAACADECATVRRSALGDSRTRGSWRAVGEGHSRRPLQSGGMRELMLLDIR
jgi:hypothetical protein